MSAMLVAVILVLVVVVVVGFGLAGWAAIGVTVRSSTLEGQSETGAAETMARLFDGSPQVLYKAPNIGGGISTATLLRGANEHGYRLVSEQGQMAARQVVFVKV